MDELEEPERGLAALVLEYLTRYPNAMDTIEGITRFWMGSDFVAASPQQVEAAVNRLVDRGLMERRWKPDGEWIYGLAKGALPEAIREDGEAS